MGLMAEEPEPPLLSIIMAPFRLAKRFVRGILARLPITDYMLRQYERDREEVEGEIEDALRSTGEMEREIRELEREAG